MSITNEQILQKLCSDYQNGGLLLYQRYYKPLVIFANLQLSNFLDAEDIVQDVFLNFIKSRAYRKIDSKVLHTYLFRAVKNSCLNALKRNAVELSDLDVTYFEAIEEEVTTIDPQLLIDINVAIDNLPEKTRRIVKAILIEGQKYKEVADNFGISVNTVKTLFSAGLKKLREQFPENVLIAFIFMLS